MQENIPISDINRLVTELRSIDGVVVNIYIQYIHDVQNSTFDHVNINETIKTKPINHERYSIIQK